MQFSVVNGKMCDFKESEVIMFESEPWFDFDITAERPTRNTKNATNDEVRILKSIQFKLRAAMDEFDNMRGQVRLHLDQNTAIFNGMWLAYCTIGNVIMYKNDNDNGAKPSDGSS